MAAGANDASKRVQSIADACPDSKIVLGGYSQGAAVIDVVTTSPIAGLGFTAPMPATTAPHIAAVAVFGNPRGADRPAIDDHESGLRRPYCRSVQHQRPGLLARSRFQRACPLPAVRSGQAGRPMDHHACCATGPGGDRRRGARRALAGHGDPELGQPSAVRHGLRRARYYYR